VSARRLKGPRAKIERAKEHVRDLEAEVRRFHETRPYEVGTDEESQPGKRLTKLTKAERPPDRLALIAGDVIHNLRSALDLLIWQLVEANGVTPSRQDAFPIHESAEKFEAQGVPRVKGRIAKDALDVLRAVKPYQGGNDALWRLHHLDIADKHRTLYLVGSAFQSMALPFPIPSDWPAEAVEGMRQLMGQTFYRPADRMFPLKEGDVLFIDNEPAQPKTEMKFRFDVAFGQGEIVEGEPILDVLNELGDATEKTVELFAPLL
jgi:hypothetical protein